MRRGTLGLALVVLAIGCAPSRESISAGQIGCAPEEITITDGSSSMGWMQSAETWVAECQGRKFICSKLTTSSMSDSDKGYSTSTDADVSCHEDLGSEKAVATKSAAAASPAASKAVAPPTGGGGFELGATAEAAQKACEDAGNTWERADARATCSGPVTKLGFDATVAFDFCGEGTCKITLAHVPQTKWVASLAELKGKLVEKYGAPENGTSGIPAACRAEADFPGCLEKGLRLHFEWSWKSRETLRLLVGKPERGTGPPAFRVEYARPASALGVNGSAL